MGKLSFLAYAFIFLIVGLIASYFYLIVKANGESRQNLTAPVPQFLSLLSNAQVATLNLWFPGNKQLLATALVKPELSAQSALSYDLTTKQFLFTKNIKQKLPMASLTKIMTAILVLEHANLNDVYTVASQDLVGEDSVGLSAGEKLSVRDLLYGMILLSGNDAAEVLARNSIFGRVKFIRAMNDQAQALGLVNTNFTNPTGLEGDGKQYTTAEDLLTITRYALDNFPIFAQIVATIDYTIPQTTDHAAYYFSNETNLLTSYPGVKGVKTGYTPEAGLCLVTYLEYGNHRIIGVILNSDNRRDEMKEILDYSLKTLNISPPAHS